MSTVKATTLLRPSDSFTSTFVRLYIVGGGNKAVELQRE